MGRPRILAGVAALSAAALALTACSNGGGTNGAGTATGGSGTDTGTGENITLTISTFNEFGYDDLFKEYEDSHPGITIEHQKADTMDNARTAIMTGLAAGSGLPDIVAAEVSWLTEILQYSDNFVDLSSSDVDGRWLDWKAQAATVDGKLLGYGTDIGPEAVCYRSDLFAQAGLPTDREEVATLLDGDWDKYFEVGQQFTAATGIPWFDGLQGTYTGMVQQIANPFETSDGTARALADDTEVKAIYDQLAANYNISAHLGQWSEDWTAAFQNNGFATMLCPAWMTGVIAGNAEGVTGWDIANVYPGGGGNWGGSYLMVPAQSAHPDEAKALADWLTAPEQQIKAFLAKGTFPSQVDALESSDLLDATNEFFNNAPYGQIFSDRAKDITVQSFQGPAFYLINTVVADAVLRVDVNGEDAASSWDKALTAFNDLGLTTK